MNSPSKPEVSKLHAILGLLSNLIVRIAATPGVTKDDDDFVRQTVQDAQDILDEVSGIVDYVPKVDIVHPLGRKDDREQKLYELTVMVFAAFASRVWGDHWILPKGKFSPDTSVLILPAPPSYSPYGVYSACEGFNLGASSRCAHTWRRRSSGEASVLAMSHYPELGNIQVVGWRDSDYWSNPLVNEAFILDVLHVIESNKPINYTQDLYPKYLTEDTFKV